MPVSKTDNVVLRAEGISKAFGGIKALDDVSLEIYAGKVNAIVGENGAGKSTLMKILSGAYSEHDGQIVLDGREVKFANPAEAQGSGIAIIHQELNLIPHLSVAENVFLGREQTRHARRPKQLFVELLVGKLMDVSDTAQRFPGRSEGRRNKLEQGLGVVCRNKAIGQRRAKPAWMRLR